MDPITVLIERLRFWANNQESDSIPLNAVICHPTSPVISVRQTIRDAIEVYDRRDFVVVRGHGMAGQPEPQMAANGERQTTLPTPPFWLVWSPQGHSSPKKQHPDKVSAEKEAARMAKAHPGSDFYVVCPLVKAESGPIKITCYDLDGIPF